MYDPRVSRLVAVLASAALASALQQPVPVELKALAQRAAIEGSIAAWCRGEFIPNRRGAFAAAIGSPSGGGRYVVLHGDATVTELARFASGPDLACYTRAAAAKLDTTIKRSETIQGQVRPRWNTTVVCGFLDDTTAECWQYSPGARKFVKIGGWTT